MPMSSAEKSAQYRAKDVEAYRARKAEYAKTPEQREKRRLYLMKWREENRERYNKMCAERHKKAYHYNRTPEERHDEHLRRWYGIDRAEYLQMLEEQDGCGICGVKMKSTDRMFHVDHSHKTGEIRGILCNSCNGKLGWFEKNEVSALVYLTQDLTGRKKVKSTAILKTRKISKQAEVL